MTGERVLSCEEALRFLATYLDGELDATTDREVEWHIARCRTCYSRADFERRIKDRVVALGRSAVRPEFAERVQRLLDGFARSPDKPQS